MGGDLSKMKAFYYLVMLSCCGKRGFCSRIMFVVNFNFVVIKHEGHLNCVLKINGYIYLLRKGSFAYFVCHIEI